MGGKSAGSWRPGQSGNPKGRPKRGDTFADLLAKELKKRKYTVTDENGVRKLSGKQAIIQAHLTIIFSKDVSADTRMRAIDSMYDRCDGRPRQGDIHLHSDIVEIVPPPKPEDLSDED